MPPSPLNPAPNSVTIGGQRIAYRTAGDPANPPLLMVHGWLSHSRVWRHLLDHLQDTHFCVAIDLLGFGDSDAPKGGDYSIEAQGWRVLALADALGIDRFDLIGHSMGGQIALTIAGSLAPERVNRVIDVAGVVSGALAWWPKYISRAQFWLGMVMPVVVAPTVWLFRIPFFGRFIFGTWFHTMPPLETWVEDRERAMQSSGVVSGYPAVRAILNTDTTPHLGSITAPALVIFGRQDHIVPPREGDRAHAGIPGAQIVWYDPCGHFPMLERPTEFNAAVAGFLAQPVALALS